MRLDTGAAIFTVSLFCHVSALQAGEMTSADSHSAIEQASVTSSSTAIQLAALGDTDAAVNEPVTPSAIEPYTATYSAKYNGLPITTERTFTIENGRYRVATEAKNFLGSIREEAIFVAAETGAIRPLRYNYQRSIFGNERSEESVFDPRAKTVTNTYKKETVTLPAPAEVLGPLSYQVQMQLDLMAGEREFSYPVVTRGRIKDYRYRILRTEKLETPLGDIDTLVLERVRDDDKRQTYLWVAQTLQYLPVKLEQQEDGESYEMSIKSYTLDEN